MNRPTSFFHLPAAFQEDALWDMDLDYDHYDSSKAEAIHEMMAGYGIRTHHQRNAEMAEKWFANLDDDSLKIRLNHLRDELTTTLDSIDSILG